MKKAILHVMLAFSILILFSKCDKEDDIEVGSFSDPRDDQTYKWVKIGDQVWMAENLKYLPEVVGPATGLGTLPYYYVTGYDGTDINAAKATNNYQNYGVLYNWRAAMNSASSSSANPSGVQGVCPIGWHVPSDAEWTELTDYAGSNPGKKLKSTSGWIRNGTDELGFSALPGGYRNHYDGVFTWFGENGYWWSASEDSFTTAWLRGLYRSNDLVDRVYIGKDYGFSVRCVQD